MKSCISKIRELIIKPVLYSLLSKNYKKWHLICGSIDAVETTQLAVDSYVCLDKDKLSYIGPHLVTYGLFQALYVQQDAVSHLCESMDIPLDIKTQYPEVYEIRQLRNKCVGHPSKEGKRGKPKNIHGMSISKNSIKLFSYTETWESSYPEYRISDCIEIQNKSLSGILLKVIEKMRSMEKKHKDKYKQNKLRDFFFLSADPQYRFEKIFQAVNLIETYQGAVPEKFGHKISFALDKTRELIEAIEKFEGEITKRELQHDDVVFVRIEIEHSKYPLEKLKEYFLPGSKSSLSAQDARAFADSARIHILDLVECAESLDYEYVRKC